MNLVLDMPWIFVAVSVVVVDAHYEFVEVSIGMENERLLAGAFGYQLKNVSAVGFARKRDNGQTTSLFASALCLADRVGNRAVLFESFFAKRRIRGRILGVLLLFL